MKLATSIAEKCPRHLLPVIRGFFALLDAADSNLSSEVVGKLFCMHSFFSSLGTKIIQQDKS